MKTFLDLKKRHTMIHKLNSTSMVLNYLSRSFHSGSLILPSLAELRKEVLTLPVKTVGKIKLSGVQIDAYELHRRPEVH